MDRLCMTMNPGIESDVVRILDENVYRAEPPRSWFPHPTMDGLTLALLYMGDGAARKTNQVVKESRLPIRLVFRAPLTLKDLLTSTRVYESKCLERDYCYCTGKDM
ncbi:hypothetical protein Y032_0208g2053 [Ancylostoma ceylanicum]|uniref:Uncharacterized protein n=1 Tax=Ancylostoma ceylanicum TaxID=53326 RepID=A0A016SLG7_9BILA|nr:hypothetical protein Y032_0208g2053 [Ancylostoma ceylanicum]